MTLAAAILFLGFSSFMSVAPGLAAPSAQQSQSSSNAAAQEQAPQGQPAPEATKPSAQSPSAQTPAGKKKASAAKTTRHRKKVVPDPCDPTPANSNSAGSSSTSPPQPGNTQGQTSSPDSKNCPPAKIIVRQGGIIEQSIQLAGGSGADDATRQTDAVNGMLAATEENLKKVSEQQLNAEQQNTVSQIRQFVGQSRSAVAAGDFERAHTLAWKAKLLSDDLINPQK